mmetsp:Transcript_89352/g.213438  ORF Transcript_89352/g.213438 Transcript_89352/m.213438 type:complete len:414 (-) Transcript_89352:215-1456(-)
MCHHCSFTSARRCDGKHQLGSWLQNCVGDQLLDLEWLEDCGAVLLRKAAASQEVGAILQVPQEIKLRPHNGSFSEALLQVQGVFQRKEILCGTLGELKRILLFDEADGISQRLAHLVIGSQVLNLLLLLGCVLQRHGGSHDVRQLELPGRKSGDVLLVDKVHPASGDGLVLARLSIDHVLDQVLHLKLLFCVQLNGVLLFLLVLAVFLLVLFVILLFLILLVLLVLVIFLVLLVFLVFLLVLLLLGRHELAQDFLHVLDAKLVNLLITELWQLGLGLFQLWPHDPVPQPVGERARCETAPVVQLALLEDQIHGAPILGLLHGADSFLVLLFLLLARGISRILLLVTAVFPLTLWHFCIAKQGQFLRIVLLLFLLLLLHAGGFSPFHEEDLEVAVRLTFFCRHRCLHRLPLCLR